MAIVMGAGFLWAVRAEGVDMTSCGGAFNTYYRDVDGDSYGNPDESLLACSQPDGYVADETDCDDESADINPGKTEICDELDNNCSGENNEGLATSTYYLDFDEDGYGTTSTTIVWCAMPAGYADVDSDCDDSEAVVNPGAAEICDGLDNNCDGEIDEGLATSTYYLDNDNDGHGVNSDTVVACALPKGYAVNTNDCNNSDATVHPGAAELCDSKDNDCDGVVDEGCVTANTYYRDFDSDGYGNPGNSIEASVQPAGYVVDNTDCNDNDADVNPSEMEVCDGKDNDCDGTVDNGLLTTYYRDADNDGYGHSASSTQACSLPDGYTENSTDCNDSDADVNPGETEVCDGKDNDCDDVIDEGCGLSTYYRDADGDGYGDPDKGVQAAVKPDGYVNNNEDCDDSDADVNPSESEVCDDIDNDCDGYIDEGCGLTTYYRDYDDDGYGDPDKSIQAESQPDGYVSDNDDCNDSDEDINPGASEVCDDIDNDCDGAVDEGCEDDDECDCQCTCECTCKCTCQDGSQCDNNCQRDCQRNGRDNDEEDEDDGMCGCSTWQHRNHGSWVSCMAHCTNSWKQQGDISGRDKGQLMSQIAKIKIEVKNNYKNKGKGKK